MNWFYLAQRDFAIYGDVNRIKNFVLKEKITPDQFKEITDVEYTL